MVQQVTANAEYDDLINSHPVVIVDFFAVWCGPCKAVAPVLESMDQGYNAGESKVKFLKVDVDQMRDLAVKLKITAMPTFLIYQNGVLKETIIGADVTQIRKTLDELTSAAAPVGEAVAV